VSLSVDSNSIDEGSSAIITLTSDAVSESDIRIPLSVSGTATEVSDYTTVFTSKGEETLISNIDSNYERYGILEDGRHVLLNGSSLFVYNPSSGQSVSVSLSRYYNYLL